MPKFARGARPSPRHALLAAVPHVALTAPPPQFAMVPTRTDFWGNDKDGDCVSAEEAAAKAAYSVFCGLPETFATAAEVLAFARVHGWLNGATLVEVLDEMSRGAGMLIGGQRYKDGGYSGVDYSDETILQSAITVGPVKIAIDADALPKGAGNQRGWHAFGRGHFPNTDHCVALLGYGTAGFCFAALGLPVPAGVDPGKPSCYLLFTWNTIGVVDHDWLTGTCTEAWVRNPTTPGQAPSPPPDPPPLPPNPNPLPPPTPERPMNLQLNLNADLVPPHTVNVRAVSYTLTGKGAGHADGPASWPDDGDPCEDGGPVGLVVPPEVYALVWAAVREYGLKALSVAWPVIRADLAAGKGPKEIAADVWAAMKAAVIGD